MSNRSGPPTWFRAAVRAGEGRGRPIISASLSRLRSPLRDGVPRSSTRRPRRQRSDLPRPYSDGKPCRIIRQDRLCGFIEVGGRARSRAATTPAASIIDACAVSRLSASARRRRKSDPRRAAPTIGRYPIRLRCNLPNLLQDRHHGLARRRPSSRIRRRVIDAGGYRRLPDRGYRASAGSRRRGDPSVAEDFLPISHLIFSNTAKAGWRASSDHGVSPTASSSSLSQRVHVPVQSPF